MKAILHYVALIQRYLLGVLIANVNELITVKNKMFSSLKKWVKNEENPQVKQPPAGLQTMRSDLQRKFAKGVQYNCKF